MWQSSASTYTVDSSGSLYSMDHSNADGDLYVWGDYHTLTNDYWSFATDFDGTGISSTPRQVNVRIDPSSNVTVDSGDTLTGIGDASRRISVSRQGGSNGYGLISDGGAINFQYANFDYLDGPKGIDIRSGSSVTSLDNTYFDNLIDSGSSDAYIYVDTSVIGSGAKTITNVYFGNSGGANFNVNRSDAEDSGYWMFDQAIGPLADEDFDAKNGLNEDNPGMIRWILGVLSKSIQLEGSNNFEGSIEVQ
jgi:hypothetical protein